MYFFLIGMRDSEGKEYGEPYEYIRWKIAKQYGWTLREVDAITMQDLTNYYQIQDAERKAASFLRGS